jgi:hypothetical protein
MMRETQNWETGRQTEHRIPFEPLDQTIPKASIQSVIVAFTCTPSTPMVEAWWDPVSKKNIQIKEYFGEKLFVEYHFKPKTLNM